MKHLGNATNPKIALNLYLGLQVPGLTSTDVRKRSPYLKAHLAFAFQGFASLFVAVLRPSAQFLFTLLPSLKNSICS